MPHDPGHDFGIELFCKDCRFSFWMDDMGPIGECRFKPPVYSEGRLARGLAAFPKVQLDDHWCGKGQTFGQRKRGAK